MSNLDAVKKANKTGDWSGVTGKGKQGSMPAKPAPAKPAPAPKA